MANHVIDRDTAGMLIALVADRGRLGAGVVNHIGDDAVNLFRGLADKHMRCDIVEDARGQCARPRACRQSRTCRKCECRPLSDGHEVRCSRGASLSRFGVYV